MEEGMPYQTRIASVLHKYVTGRLEKRKADDSGSAPRFRKRDARDGRN
jgi:hypothetical protein